ncbi:GTP-binding protein LepA [Aggregatimonas sangjinii]|uniref:GTP-binding protein LepA n=1 Tax=Aggregatimonas sangjinii TaxID=2583587 RepID=A0A5B7STB9_9FLAO|nr:GTP-binding protein LepA [Aggregatimonas sangjinii]QCX01916.1 GTP-binding protein LepA [Aggregatimonas sangjinii]
MTTYIAQFHAVHNRIEIAQQSCFIWRQESGEIDNHLLEEKIKRESSIHFYKMLVEGQQEITFEDITVKVWSTETFSG